MSRGRWLVALLASAAGLFLPMHAKEKSKTMDDLQFIIISKTAAKEVAAKHKGDLAKALKRKAVRVITEENLLYVTEGYLGILDSHDCDDLAESANSPLAKDLVKASGEPESAVWLAIDEAHAPALAAKMEKIRISEKDVEDYFGDQELAGQVRALHESLQKVLKGLEKGQVLVFRADHL